MLQGFFQIALTLLLVVGLTPILGGYLAKVFMAKETFLDPVMTPVEQGIYLLGDVEPSEDMTGWQYAQAVLISNSAMAILVFLLLIFQGWLPLNPTQLGMPTWDTALHTTISFLVAADLQHYSGETTMSYLSQIAALGFLMFVAPATGAAVGVAFIRGLTGKPLGNFYVDLTRSITRVLLPISIVGAVVLTMLSSRAPSAIFTVQAIASPHVIARASSEIHIKLLKRIGADHVVYPEYDAGCTLARSLCKAEASLSLPVTSLRPELD